MASNQDSGEKSKESEKQPLTEGKSHLPADEDLTVESIRRYIAEKLGFYDGDRSSGSDEQPKVLDDVSIDGIVKFINGGKCKNILTMAGAGISTSAGIPDFRSPGSGLYHNLQKYKLPNPQAIFEIGFFRQNPKPFFTLAKELFPGTFKPTLCHYFIKLLNKKNLLLRHYTQNIDTLERVAGLPGDKLVEAHGTFFTSHCLECDKAYSVDWMKDRIFQDLVPECPSCKGVVKPDIVFFGETLPSTFYENSVKDFPEADLLIVMGSSLAVQPFASLTDKVKKSCPRLLINKEKVGQRDRLMEMFGMGSGMDFDSDSNTRDVLFLGDCDLGCETLADKLGWGDELRTMVKEGHTKIDEDKAKESHTGDSGGHSGIKKESLPIKENLPPSNS